MHRPWQSVASLPWLLTRLIRAKAAGRPAMLLRQKLTLKTLAQRLIFWGTRSFVDRNRIGVIGICGFGGMALNAAAVDKRIGAVATASMYDMSRLMSKGLNDSMDEKQRTAVLEKMGQQRWADAESDNPAIAARVLPEKLDANSDPVTREFFEYYRTPRGFHKNSPNSTGAFTVTTPMSFMNFPLMTNIREISPRPILLIAGEKAHSRYFSEDAYKNASEPKELVIIPGANHVDLYDRKDRIPFEKLADFFEKNLKAH